MTSSTNFTVFMHRDLVDQLDECFSGCPTTGSCEIHFREATRQGDPGFRQALPATIVVTMI